MIFFADQDKTDQFGRIYVNISQKDAEPHVIKVLPERLQHQGGWFKSGWCVLFAFSVHFSHPPHMTYGLRDCTCHPRITHRTVSVECSKSSRRGSLRANPQLDATWPRSYGSLGRQFLVFLRHPHGLSRHGGHGCNVKRGRDGFMFVCFCRLLFVSGYRL